jgi:YcxB-like protein
LGGYAERGGWERLAKYYRIYEDNFVQQIALQFNANVMITISFNLTKDDALALACHYYANSPTVRKNRIASQVGAFSIMAGAGLLLVWGNEWVRPIAVIMLVLGGVSAACAPAWYRSNLQKTASKMFEETSYQKAFGNYTLTLSEDGLASKSPIGSGSYTWEAVDRVALTPEYLFIFLVGPQGFPIPRSQASDSNIQEVKAFVESHLKTTKPGVS